MAGCGESASPPNNAPIVQRSLAGARFVKLKNAKALKFTVNLACCSDTPRGTVSKSCCAAWKNLLELPHCLGNNIVVLEQS